MKLLAIIAVMSAAPATAQGVDLWGGIHAGITLDEALALYPKRKLQLTPECKLDIEFKFDDTKERRITGVRLRGSGYNACGPLVRDSLRTKYGEPVEVSEQKLGVMEKIVTYRHQNAELTISMNLAVNNPDGAIPFGNYDVVYQSRSIAMEAAAKL